MVPKVTWQYGVMLASPLSVDFKPVCQLCQPHTRSSVRHILATLAHSQCTLLLYPYRTAECSKVVLTNTQFSQSATLPNLV